MKRYYIYDFSDNYRIFIGEFNSDDDFWNHFHLNSENINIEKSKYKYASSMWYMDRI